MLTPYLINNTCLVLSNNKNYNKMCKRNITKKSYNRQDFYKDITILHKKNDNLTHRINTELVMNSNKIAAEFIANRQSFERMISDERKIFMGTIEEQKKNFKEAFDIIKNDIHEEFKKEDKRRRIYKTKN